MFGYQDFFLENGAVLPEEDGIENEAFSLENRFEGYMQDFNNQALKNSIALQNETDEVTSIYINYPALLLRKKSALYPMGRTSHRFKN